MITPQERAEKMRSAPRHTSQRLKKLTPEEREKRLRQALEHDNDAGMSMVDEYVYLKQRESSGK